MTHEERISHLEVMMSDVLRRLDQLSTDLSITSKRLDQVTAELHATNEALRALNQRQEVFGQQQQVILDVLVRQTDTNTAILQKLVDQDSRLRTLETPSSKNT